MSTISAHEIAPCATRRLEWRAIFRGDAADPAWSRPSLIGIAALAGVLVFWGLTRNGFANTYYASAVYAQSHSWHAFFFNSLDLSGFVSVDKTPLATWMMALSARLLGFSSFTMLLPNALCGVASMLVLHATVKRTLGNRTAIVAALLFALSPIVIVMARFDNPDALLVLLLLCSAWALVRTLESGRTCHLLLCGVLVGLAFNTKMLQAYLAVPALAVTYLLAGPGNTRRRVMQLLAAGAAMFAISAAWVGTMSLIPAASRPYAGDSQTNSWWNLIFGANGLNRVGSGSSGARAFAPPGGGGPGTFGGQQGAWRLLNAEVGGQIAWLLPLAIVGLLSGLWLWRRAGRTDRVRAGYVLWGTWAAVHVVLFSFTLTLFHPYYTNALAPALAALAAGGLVALWDRARDSRLAGAWLAAALIATGAMSFELLGRDHGFVPWLRWLIAAAAVTGAAWALVGRGWRPVLIAAVALTVLAGPTAYTLASMGRSIGSGNPTAGPSSASQGMLGGGPGAAGNPGLARPMGGLSPPRAGNPPRPPRAGGPQASRQLVRYLEAHRAGTKYLVAASSSMIAAPILLATHANVLTIGGFDGSDPAPSIVQLTALLRDGQLRYVLIGGGPTRRDSRQSWISSNCVAVGGYQGLYDCSNAGRGRI